MNQNNNWGRLSLNEKADLFKIYVAGGYTSLDDIKNHYNSFADGGFTQKILNTAKNVARKAINSEARLADTYSSKKYTFEEAYKDARSKGQRTFFWNGNYYNTDYEGSHGKQYKADLASGKAQAFEAQYPNFTNPELRKEKQEELDTYGITNEQTKNKNILHNRLLNNIVPGGYISPLKQAFNAIVLNKSGLNNEDFVSLPDNTNTPTDQFRMWLGYPQFTGSSGEIPTFSISAYRPQNAEFPYYLHQIGDSPIGSEYKTNNLQYLHDKLKEVGDRYMQTNSDKDADEFQKLYNAIYGDKNNYTVGRFQINKDGTIIDSYNEKDIENGNNIVSGEWLGDYTIGKSPNFISYYDKWDINPFSTNAPRYGGKANKFLNNLIEKGPLNTKIGTPLNLYNRAYIEEEPNIDYLYSNFAQGGYLDNLTTKPFSYQPLPVIRYADGGPRKSFRRWANAISDYKGIDVKHDNTYDYRGFYNDNPDYAYSMLGEDPEAHFPDTWKTPKHPTFSDESIYSNEKTQGGHWLELPNDVWEFQHSDYTYKHSDETNQYLRDNDPSSYATYQGGLVLDGASHGLKEFSKKVLAPIYGKSFEEAFSKARSKDKEFFRWRGDLYNTRIAPERDEPFDIITDVVRRLKLYENSKDNPTGGFDKELNIWRPHASVEGGADTIAYGIKLSNGTKWAEIANKQGYLTDAQVEEATTDLANEYYQSAIKIYDKKYGEGSFNQIDPRIQSILVDFNYNPGLNKFPKLMEAVHNNDVEAIYREYKRYVNGKELARNKGIKNELDAIYQK